MNSQPRPAAVENRAKPKLFVRWQLCILLVISANAYVPARINFAEFDRSVVVTLQMLDGKSFRRRRDDLVVVRYKERPHRL